MGNSVIKHGGKREGAGRPPQVNGKKRTVYLSDQEWEYLCGVSPNGTASGGIRELIEWDTRHTYDEIKKQGGDAR